jgi:hypothetical protein
MIGKNDTKMPGLPAGLDRLPSVRSIAIRPNAKKTHLSLSAQIKTQSAYQITANESIDSPNATVSSSFVGASSGIARWIQTAVAKPKTAAATRVMPIHFQGFRCGYVTVAFRFVLSVVGLRPLYRIPQRITGPARDRQTDRATTSPVLDQASQEGIS